MNELVRVFRYSGNNVRTVTKDEETVFVVNDACEILDLKNPRFVLARLDEDEKGVCSIDTLGGVQEVNVVTEAGLYSLILGSRKKEAKDFKRWITHEVLPSIRKTGMYLTQEMQGQLAEIQNGLALLSVSKAPDPNRDAYLRVREITLDIFHEHLDSIFYKIFVEKDILGGVVTRDDGDTYMIELSADTFALYLKCVKRLGDYEAYLTFRPVHINRMVDMFSPYMPYRIQSFIGKGNRKNYMISIRKSNLPI